MATGMLVNWCGLAMVSGKIRRLEALAVVLDGQVADGRVHVWIPQLQKTSHVMAETLSQND